MRFEEITASEYLRNLADFSTTFDVRSPSEFATSHIPHSQNLFALDDDERAEVGTLHARTAFEARLLGAGLICKNLSNHLTDFDHTPAEKLVIYCARGQMRSGSIATVLSFVGFRIFRIIGGYKAYRQEVLKFFESLSQFDFVLLDGPTGSGKSELIRDAKRSIDLESFARHKGSVFGAMGATQPTNAHFENSLMHRLLELGSDGKILLEAESKNIGKVTIPHAMYDKMKKSFRIYVDTPIESRIERIVTEYRDMDKAFFDQAMARIARYISKILFDEIVLAYEHQDLHKTAELLLTQYYDKVYRKADHYDMVLRFDSFDQAKSELDSLLK